MKVTSRRLAALVCLAALWTAAALGLHRPVLGALAPLAAALPTPVHGLRMHDLVIERGSPGADRVVARFALTRSVVLAGGARLEPGIAPRVTAHVPAAGFMQLPLALLTVVLVVRSRTAREQLAALALAIVASAFGLLVDMPVALGAAAWTVLDAARSADARAAADHWTAALSGGGRIAVGIACGVVCVRIARWLEDGWPEPRQRV